MVIWFSDREHWHKIYIFYLAKAHEKYKHVNIQCKIYLLLHVFGRVEQDEKLKSVGYKLCCEVYPFLEVHKYYTTTYYLLQKWHKVSKTTAVRKNRSAIQAVHDWWNHAEASRRTASVRSVINECLRRALQRPSKEPKYVAASLHQLSAHTQVYSGI